ncbi:DUF7562 family protein [Haloglomus salinum]|jgi:hypothetical protein|uniref:DUF7562 family protein n=1 Tax=Haloglomus salinum TaxID=2962673 RepID=UPI0020C94939|nr:hypothetical protein [Haloglomus salinum]
MTTSTLWTDDSDQQVTCIACGDTVDREDAREYDKHGDRWSREGKAFEYLCKPCHRECCHQNRDGLEETLVAAGAGRTDRKTFLERYCEFATEDTEPGTTES